MRAVTVLLVLTATASAAEPVDDWKSILDAPKDKAEWAASPTLSVVTPPHFFDGGIAFADQGGPFAAVGRNGGRSPGAKGDEYRIVVDLRTGKTVGTIRDTFDSNGHGAMTALSFDGKRLAAAVGGRFGQPTKVSVFDAATGKLEGDIAVTGEIDVVQFGGDRLLVSTKTASDVYDAATRKSVLNVDHQRNTWGGAKSTLTPTGQFLIETTGTGLRMYDVAAGKSLFKMESPRRDKDKGTNADGVAVSPDGKRMAVLTESFNQRQLVVYDTATGKVLFDNPSHPVKNVFYSQRVAWSADSKGVLLNGEAIVDPETGKAVYEFPATTHATKLAVTLGNGVVWDTADRNARRLVLVGLTAEKTAAAKAAVNSGGTAADVLLPPLTKATFDLSKATPPQIVGVPWRGQPDPAPPTGAGGQPTPLDFALNNLRVFFVTGGAKPTAVFEFTPNGADPAKTRQVRSVDLTTGRSAPPLELPPTLQIEDVTADGSVVMAYDYVASRRLDFFPLGGKPYGFKPYESQPEAERKLVVNRFLANDRVVTVNEKGVVVVWSLPDCQPQVVASLPGTKAWALSPNKKYLAGIQNGAVRMLDLATGTVAGDLLPSFTPQPTPLNSFILFRADGREVLAGFQNSAGPVLTRWDTTTGRIRHEAPYAGTLGSVPKPGYVGDTYQMVDFGRVYDLDRQAFVWTLVGGTYAWFRPDDRVWYAVPGTGAGGTLVAAKFPTDDVDQTIAEIADGPGAVFKPGTRVGLSLDVDGGLAKTFRPKIADAVKAGWKTRELELVSKDAEVEVGIRVAERDTGEKLNFRNFGGFGGESVRVLELTAETTISVNGEVLWSPEGSKHRTNGGFGILHLPQGETDVGEYLHKQMWAGVVAWGQINAMPRFLAKTAAGVKALPQTSLLTATGIVASDAAPRRRR